MLPKCTTEQLGFHESTIYPDMQHIASEQRAQFAGKL